MRIKIISHNRMKTSVNYLYDKLDNPDCKFHPKLGTFDTAKEFISEIYDRIDEHTDRVNKSIDINNTIKHLVVAFSPDDKENLNKNLDDILEDVFKELDIDPENQNLTAFIHNDRAHPHVHLIFSRVGVDGKIFDDQKLGWKINTIANKLDKKYELAKPKKGSITIRNKYLYGPTTRGSLLKLINFATIESKNLTEFQNILKEYGVIAKKTPDGKFNYITKDRTVFAEKILPKEARMSNLYTLIKTQKHTKAYTELRNDIQTKLLTCKTLNEVKEKFPDAIIKYQRKDDQILNLTIEQNGMQIKLHEALQVEIKTGGYIKNDYSDFPLIFVPTNPDTRDAREEERQKRMSKKNGKKTKQLGFKVQI